MAASLLCLDVRALALPQPSSWPASFYPPLLEELSQLLPRVEHARFHCIRRDSDDLGRFLDRLLVIVHEIDDFPMLRRQAIEALAQEVSLVLLLDGDLGRIRRVLDRRSGLFVQLL